MNKFAVVVHACDSYSLLFKGFEHFFVQHFPIELPFVQYYFLTEELHYDSTLFTNVRTGKGEWSDRLKRGLEKVEASHLLYFQEDMWLLNSIPSDILSAVYQLMLDKKANLVKLNSSDVYKTVSTGEFINGLSVSRLDNEKSDYLMSHQIAFWDKDFLIKQLYPNEHPWRNERKATKRLKKMNQTIYHLDLFSENGQPPNNSNQNGSYRGLYYTISSNSTLNPSSLIFIEKLRQVPNNEFFEYAELLHYNQQNGRTHNGLPIKRKKDVFKTIKNYFLNFSKLLFY